jgi:hypothetical protein
MYDKALEKREDQKIWEIWLARIPNMDAKNNISFEQFKRKLMRPKISQPTMTVEEQIKEAERIKTGDRKR